MVIVGLTGSIGMGKSAAATHVRAHGIPVFDADAEVHRLYAGAAASLIEAAFPGTTTGGQVDRGKLSAALAHDSDGFRKLESIVHPLVRDGQRAFLRAAEAAGQPLAILEIPLLMETGADRMVDATVVVSAGAAAQRTRVLARPGMTVQKLDLILGRQLPDDEKRRRADFVVDTSGPIDDTRRQIDELLPRLREVPAQAFVKFWR